MTDDVCRMEIEAPEAEEVADVRHWVADRIGSWDIREPQRDDILLVASELVTNSVRHARTAVGVCLRRAGEGCVRVEVFDRDTRLPMAVGTDDEATSGRGLQIVATIASDWGSRTEEQGGIHGKVVWAELCPEVDDDQGASD